MKIRKFRKKFWYFPTTGYFMRSHCRKVKPLPGTKWLGNNLVTK